MTDALTALLSRFRGREVLIDTNILLMYIVGTLDPQLFQPSSVPAPPVVLFSLQKTI